MNLIEIKNQLICAYETILNPGTSVKERKEAELYCENLKCSGYSAFQVGASLLDARNGHSLHLRNLGVNFIEYCIKNVELEVSEQIALRHQFWSLVFCEEGAFDCLNEKILLKEKVASCMAILACNLWLRPEDDPVQWNDFFEIGILQNVLNNSNFLSSNPDENLRRQEFALLTISHLINYIRATSNDSPLNISEDRRLQLLAGLEIVLPSFTEWLFINFSLAVDSNVSFQVLNGAVNCFKAICTWMGNLNIKGLENFITSCFKILLTPNSNEDLVLNILDTLQIYFSQKNFNPSEQEIVEFFLISLYPQTCSLLQIYSQNVNEEYEEESYQKLKLLVQCFTSIGNRQICHKKNPLIPKNINDLFGLFVALGQIQSVTIYLDILEFLLGFLKCEILLEKINFNLNLPQLFLLLTEKLTRKLSEEFRSPMNRIDFEELSEFKEFWNISKNRSGDLIKNLTCKFPETFLEFSYNSLGIFIQSNSSTLNLNNNNNNNNNKWEGLLLVEEFIAKGLETCKCDEKLQGIYLLHLQLLTLHSPIPCDITVLEKWINCVKSFTALQGLSCPENDFRRSVESLFNLAMDTARPEEIRSLAASSILKLADANPSLFLPLIEPLLVAVSPLLSSSSGSWERRLFSELILIFMVQPSLSGEKQMILFAAVAGPLVELLKGAKSVLLVGNPVFSLMKQIGFDDLNDPNTSPQSRKFTSDLNLLLSTLQILFKRISPLVEFQSQSPVVQTCLQVLDELVGFLMLMIQCLHRIGTKSVWISYFNNSIMYDTFYPKIQEFLDNQSTLPQTPTQTQTQTQTQTTTLTLDVSGVTPQFVHIAGWSRHYRQSCYFVLGLAATSFGNYFYSLPKFAERFMSQPLSSLEALNLSDWNVMIKLLLKPIISSAPRELIPILVGGSLTGLLSLLAGKLEEEWQAVKIANSSIKPATGNALIQEMTRESKCINLSTGFTNFLHDLLNVISIDIFKGITLLYALEQDNLLPKLENLDEGLPALWLFSEGPESLLESLLHFIGHAMINWPRNVGVYGRLVNLQVRIITGVMGRSDFPLSNRSKFLSQSVNYALFAWMSNSWTDFQNNLIALFTEQYKWSFLLAASENHSGPMIFDSNTVNFIKNLNNKIESSFERELITKFSISKVELLNLRNSILCSEIPKIQRNSLKNLLQKHSKSLSAGVVVIEDFKQKEFSARLTEMKKRIRKTGNENENENFDTLLSDLFT